MEESEIVSQSFAKRLVYGQQTEKRFLIKVHKLVDSDAYLIDGLDKARDIVCPQVDLTFEIKDQRNARIAVCVEYARSADQKIWRPSGISTTHADYWVYFAQDKFYVIKTSVLKDFMENKPMKIYPHRAEFYKCKVIYLAELAKNSFRIWSS